MRIQHNIAALNSHRQLTNNNSSVAKNLEKLSSGYRINRAGDDAAGLAISEKMRAQITGLNTASKNAQDGISLVQTAEGALTEVHSMLNRMTELAGQAANGTYQDLVDRENAMKELTSLRSEIDRISEGTNFNGIKLLDGNLSADGKTSTAAVTVKLDVPGAMAGKVTDNAAVAGKFTSENLADIADAVLADGDKVSFTLDYVDSDGKKQSKTIDLTYKAGATAAKGGKLVAADGTEHTAAADAATVGTKVEKGSLQSAIMAELQKDSNFKDNFTVATATDKLEFTAKTTGAGGAKAEGIKLGYSGGNAKQLAQAVTESTKGTNGYQSANFAAFKTFDGTNAKDSIFTVNGKNFAFVTNTVSDDDLQKLKDLGITDYVKVAAADTVTNAEATIMSDKINFATGLKTSVATGGAVMSFKTGEVTTTKGGGLSLQIGESSDTFNQLTVSIGAMSTKALGIDEINIGTQDDAKASVDIIKNAINTVSSTRGDLGAIQNRLEHTINNLGVTAENMTAAESRIRDVDMAQEMMTFTKNNILTQASQAMLAQANQLPQGVLQLLQ